MMLHVPHVLSAEQVAETRATGWTPPTGSTAARPWATRARRSSATGSCPSTRRSAASWARSSWRRWRAIRCSSRPRCRCAPCRRCSTATKAASTTACTSTARCARCPGTGLQLRTDLSCTLFLCDPEDYDGGELEVVDTYGTHEVKLPAGDLILYPSTSLHRVDPVTRGARVCSFFWLQSMVRDERAARHAVRTRPEHPEAARGGWATARKRWRSPGTITTCCGCGRRSRPGAQTSRALRVGIVIANARNSYL